MFNKGVYVCKYVHIFVSKKTMKTVSNETIPSIPLMCFHDVVVASGRLDQIIIHLEFVSRKNITQQ